MVHADHTYTCHSTYHGIGSISTQLQQLNTDVTADITFRSNSAQLAVLQYGWRRVIGGP